MDNPFLWLFGLDEDEPLFDLGEGFSFGTVLVPLEATPTATSDELDFPFAWVLKKSNIPGNVIHDPANGLFVRPLFPAVPQGAPPGGTVVELEAVTAGTSTVAAALFNLALRELTGTIGGTSTITGKLDPNFQGTMAGQATVAGTLSNVVQGTIGFPIPYLLGLGGVAVNDLKPILYGDSTVTAHLSLERPLATTVTGTSTVTANLFTSAGPAFLSSSITGVATVTGTLQQLIAGNIVELAGTINGTSTVTVSGIENLARQAGRYLYLYLNVGVGFDDYDDASGTDGFVSQTYPDGNLRDDWARYLYQYANIGVGFDDYDTYPGAFSQTFPDGHNRDDFARYLYQYLCVIKGQTALGNLAILPSGVGRDSFIPHPDPPSNKLT